MNKAGNYVEFSEALKHYIAPAQNFAFAGRDGDIALIVNGDLPIKEDQTGRFITKESASGEIGKDLFRESKYLKCITPSADLSPLPINILPDPNIRTTTMATDILNSTEVES